MDKQYVGVSNAERQGIRLNVEKTIGRGRILNVNGSIETFPYRVGKLGLIHPEIVNFHKRVFNGDEEATELWTNLWRNDDVSRDRNNSFWYSGYSQDFCYGNASSRVTRGHYFLPEEVPVLFWDREDSGTLLDDKVHRFDRYFCVFLKEEEFTRFKDNDVSDAENFVRSYLDTQFEMLNRYHPDMLHPYEIMIELTRRVIDKEEFEVILSDRRKSISQTPRRRAQQIMPNRLFK